MPIQGPIVNWGYIHIFMFTERKNNRFEKKLIHIEHKYMNIGSPN